LNNLCVLTDTDEVNEKSDISVSESNKVKEEVEEEVKEEVKEELEENTQRVEQSKGQESRKEELELDEYNMDVDNLEETDLQLEELGIYEVYELINTKIKENIIQNIRNILINKKIKTKLDLAEMVDDEDEEE
jgi:hypothetical protein